MAISRKRASRTVPLERGAKDQHIITSETDANSRRDRYDDEVDRARSISDRTGPPMNSVASVRLRPLVFPLLVACSALALTAVSVAAQVASRTDTSSVGAIVGIVTMKDGGLPLSYSVASAPAIGRERFSDAQGVFTLGDLPAGSVQLRVRHLGYSPADISVIVRAGRTDTVRVQLSHIAVRLTAMQVRAYPECRNPGAPRASSDSAFATVFDQLQQNADQYRLLANTYPFVYLAERTFSTTLANGEVRMESVDTIRFESGNTWRYKPGELVVRGSGSGVFGGSMSMNIPTLAHFADKVFLDNHCFYNGGLESVDGVEMLRIDLVAASRIAQADVNGSMYLDPVSFQIRRSVLRLSKIPPGLSGLVETEAVSYFSEAFPSIPVIAGIESINRFAVNARRPTSPAAANEQQRLIRLQFLKGLPGESVKKPAP
jgi:hypothetical protein